MSRLIRLAGCQKQVLLLSLCCVLIATASIVASTADVASTATTSTKESAATVCAALHASNKPLSAVLMLDRTYFLWDNRRYYAYYLLDALLNSPGSNARYGSLLPQQSSLLGCVVQKSLSSSKNVLLCLACGAGSAMAAVTVYECLFEGWFDYQ